MRTFAIGDIHGCLGQLVDLLGRIDRVAGAEPHRIVCLGDYIDRGPSSAAVIELLRQRQAQAGRDRFVCLKGNHEALLLAAATRPKLPLVWLANGGDATLASYGATVAAEMPDDVVSWIAACPTSYEDEWRVYVHAGLDPERGRLDQEDSDRLWIREKFLERDHDFGRYVVHGHTPRQDGRPDVRAHRVNVDTGAVYGGPLTAAIFIDGRERPEGFIQAF